MATVTFLDTNNDGNLNTGANWSTGSIPANGDDAVCDRSGNDLFGSIAASNVLSFSLTAGWAGTQFGTSGTDVTVQSNGAGRFVDLYFGSRFVSGRLATATSTMTLLRLKSMGLGSCILTSGTFGDVRGNEQGGTALIGGSATVTALRTNAMKFYAYAGTGFTVVYVGQSGELQTERDIATGVNSSRVIMLKTAAIGTSILNTPGSVFNPRGSGTHVLAEFEAAALSLDLSSNNVPIGTLRWDARSQIQRVGKGVKLTITTDDGY